jgi:hypothetical protein
LAFLASSLLVFWSGWAINEKMYIALFAGFLVYAIYHVYITKVSAVGDRAALPPLDFKAGSWFPIWIGGLALCSYFGDVDPGVTPDPGLILDGVDGPLTLASGGIVVAAFSGVVYIYAMAVRLPTSRAAGYISQTWNVPS